MCGIAGVVSFVAPGEVLATTALRIRDRLRHRGPDGQGLKTCSHAALGHVRLALLDAAGGAQPMTSFDGRWTLVFNGEIHDHLSLRAQLDYPFTTRSDTETVLAAVAKWGEGAASRLSGMFAFFAWDEVEQRGIAARDRLGVKPLFHERRGDEFRFASEPSALIPLDGVRANRDAILEVLTAPCFSGVERCAFDGIDSLPPGSILVIDRDGVRVRRYFEWPMHSPLDGDDRSLARELRASFESAVEATLEADVDVAAMLSGGLDSTAICSLAARRRRARGRRLETFTIRYAGQADFEYARSRIVVSDDLPYARLAATELDVDLEEVIVPRGDLAADLRAIARIDAQIPAWEQQRSQHHLARAIARSHKAVLVGDAADETHYGYHFLLDPEVVEDPLAIVRRFAPIPIRREVEPRPVERFASHYRELVAAAGGSFGSQRDALAATTWLIVNRWLPRLLWNGDVHTMAFGLEARVPFADSRVLDLAMRVPPQLAFAHGVEKQVLRAAVADLLPNVIASRRKSALPKDQASTEVLRQEWSRVVADPHPCVAEIVDLPSLGSTLAAVEWSEDDRSRAFRVIAFDHWASEYDVK